VAYYSPVTDKTGNFVCWALIIGAICLGINLLISYKITDKLTIYIDLIDNIHGNKRLL